MISPHEIRIEATFDAPWPEVLVAIHDWIRTQALQVGRVKRTKVKISLSRASLLAAKAEGRSIQPTFDEFRQAILSEWKIVIDPPNRQSGLHDQGPHRALFIYWR